MELLKVSDKKQSNILMGIDPGLRVAGYSVISCAGSRVQLLDLGFLEQKSSESVQHRVGRFCEFAEYSKLKSSDFELGWSEISFKNALFTSIYRFLASSCRNRNLPNL